MRGSRAHRAVGGTTFHAGGPLRAALVPRETTAARDAGSRRPDADWPVTLTRPLR
jgi:hypothetical protein